MGKRQRSAAKEQFWRQTLARQAGSRLSVRKYCEREGLSETSYYMWRRELARRDRVATQAAAPPAIFVPVEVVGQGSVVTQTSVAIEIVLTDGVVVRAQPGFDRATLEQVVRLLAGGLSC